MKQWFCQPKLSHVFLIGTKAKQKQILTWSGNHWLAHKELGGGGGGGGRRGEGGPGGKAFKM